MAVTDLTDSLPYWARQGVGYGGGPGPTGGPGSAPMGAGGSAAWLQYLQQMFGVSPANAAENNPTAALGALSGGNDGGFNNPYQAAAGANPAQGGPYVGSGAPMAAANVAQPPPPAPVASDPATRNMPFPQNPGPAAQNMPFPSLSYCKFRHYINIELESDLPIFGRQLTRELSATSSAGLE